MGSEPFLLGFNLLNLRTSVNKKDYFREDVDIELLLMSFLKGIMILMFKIRLARCTPTPPPSQQQACEAVAKGTEEESSWRWSTPCLHRDVGIFFLNLL